MVGNQTYSGSDILRMFQKIEDEIKKVYCFAKECCAKIPVNVGNGVGLFKRFHAGKWEFKTLVEGNNITITETAREITISASGTGTNFSCNDLQGCNVSLLTNDAGYIDSTALANYLTVQQATATYQPIGQYLSSILGLNISLLNNDVGYITLTSLFSGAGISYNPTTGQISNSAPDQTVVLTQGGTTTISGTYPNFTISSTETVNTLGTIVNGATDATPSDTDLIPVSDSSVLKKLSFTNLKAFLKTYFDTIYSIGTITRLKITTGNQTNSTNISVDITGLSVTLQANKRYKIHGAIITEGVAGGIKIGTSLPSGASATIFGTGQTSSTTAFVSRRFPVAGGDFPVNTYNTTAIESVFNVWGEVTTGANAGTFKFYFYSNTNGNTSTIVQQGTLIEIHEI